jgi:soluble lytic murein transglycosylase
MSPIYRTLKSIVSHLLLSSLAFTSIANAASIDAHQQARVQQAKELLGKRYQRTIASTVGQNRKVTRFIEKLTRKSLPAKWKKSSVKIAKAILQESEKYGFDPIFLVAVIQTESSFSPVARGTSGEIGLMQLMPDTGEWVAKNAELPWKGNKTLFDPVANIRIGAAYNMGPRKLRLAVAQQIIPADYARRVMRKYLHNYAEIHSGFAHG